MGLAIIEFSYGVSFLESLHYTGLWTGQHLAGCIFPGKVPHLERLRQDLGFQELAEPASL